MNKTEASALFKVLSDESRVKICTMLYHNDSLCACNLLDMVDCKQATLSHHMKVLSTSGLVKATKEGKWMHYKLNKELLDELMSFIPKPCDCAKVVK